MSFSSVKTPYELLVSQGKITGQEDIVQSGRNGDIDSGTTPETIWHFGGLYTGFVPTAQPLIIGVDAGSSANDTAAGTGAQEITVFGLDAAGLPISEVIVTNGLVASLPTAQSFLRHHLAVVTKTGSSNANAGTLRVEQQTSTAVMSHMPPMANRTRMAIYTVPANKTFYVNRITINATSGGGTDTVIDLLIDTGGDGIFLSGLPSEIDEDGGLYQYDLNWRKVIPMTDLEIRCLSTTSNNVKVSASIHGVLIDN